VAVKMLKNEIKQIMQQQLYRQSVRQKSHRLL